MLRLAAILAWLAAAPVAPAAAAPSAVSINLCTDQLLVGLADPDQILGLGPYSRDPVRSWAPDQAARFRLLSGTAEEVLEIRPDVVLASRFTRRTTRELLSHHGLRVITFDSPSTIAEAKNQITEVGAAVGHPERAAQAVQAIDAAVARARDAAARRPRSVLPLQRRGWVSGEDTLTTSMLEAVGLRNAGGRFGRFGGQVTLEQIVELAPDLLLVSGTERAEDQGSALLLHPALTHLYPPERRLVLPERLGVCGGMTIVDALDRLAASLAVLP